MPTFTATSGRKTFRDTANAADTYVIGADATRVTIAGRLTNADVLNIEGLASEYTVRASGRTITLTNGEQTVVFQLANGATAVSVRFLDGALNAAFDGKTSTFGGTKLGKKAVDVNDANIDDTKAATAFDAGSGSGTTTTGGTFTLTTSVDSPTATSGNDTITGLIGVSGTFNVGDYIDGGAGTDTLSLNMMSGGQAPFVTLRNVENINLRLLEAGPGSALALNAQDWSGVTTLSFDNSLDETAIRVSGLSTTPTISVKNEVDVNLDYVGLTSGTDAVTVALTSAGSGGGTAESLASAGVADIDVDLDNAGLIDTMSVTLATGTNYATLEAGADLRTLNIGGAGNAYLSTDDTITALNASTASGNLDITLSGVSDVTVTGGAGNDTIRLGTTLSNNDSVNGGAGTDTVTVSVAGFNRNLNTTNVESATVTFTEAAGGTLNASASTTTAYTLAAGTAGNVAALEAVANGTTITLNDDDIGNVTLDYASGAASTTLNLGSVSGTVGVGTLAITDVANVTINAVGVSGTVGGSIGTASFDSDLKSLTIATSGGEADLAIGTDNGDMDVGGATSLTVTSNGSAGITFNNVDLAGSTLASVTINARGTDAADITVGDVSGSAITSIVLNATSGADVTVGTVDLGNNSTAGAAQNITISITQGANSDVTVGAITVTSQGTTTINVASNGTGGDLDVAAIVLDRAQNVTADSAPLNLAFGAVSVGASATYAINSIDAQNAGTGAQITFGAVTVGENADWSAGPISATATVNVDVSSVTLTVGSGASADLGAITTTAGEVGAVSLTLLGSDASAEFGAVAASAIGAYSIVAGSGAGADFGNIAAFSGGNASQGRVGAIAIAGVDGADVTFGTINASAVGAISVSGALNVTIGTITTTTLGEVNATGLGASGAFTIDLSGVSNSIEIKLGAGANTITSGDGNDVITLLGGRTAASGNDKIRFVSANGGVDNIINFIGGATASGGDQIELDVSEFATGIFAGDGSAIAAASDAVFSTGSGAAFTFDDNVILLTTAYASLTAMVTDLQADGTLASALADAASANYLVVWTDGSDTYVSLANVEGGSTGANTTLTLASASAVAITTLAQISGVSPGALVAANFDFV